MSQPKRLNKLNKLNKLIKVYSYTVRYTLRYA
jgi:hypothetical protein